MSIETNGDVLLDDGEFFVQHNSNYPPTAGNGFLMRRCRVSITTPEGAECVGGYDFQVNGKWVADIAKEYDADTDSDCRNVGSYDNRLDAIHALWTHRREAMTKHPRH